MIVNNVIGNLSGGSYSNMEVDYVDVEWYNSCKKIDRLVTHGGLEVGFRLDEHTAAHGLRQDDVLAQMENKVIAVNILPCECLVVTVTDHHILPKFCYEIGNRHAPFFYGEQENQFIIPLDKTIKVMIEKLGIPVEEKTIKLNFNKSISSSPSHGHSH